MENDLTVKTWLGCALGDAAAISRQANEIAGLFADFVGQARSSLHIAIYDFRLDPAQASTVIGALNGLSQRGIDVRVAYFKQPPRKNTAQDGGDPSPGTKASDFSQFDKKIQIKAIEGIDISALPPGVKKEPIEGGGHLMHSKYIIRDGAAVWMGSANFTTDAWSIQDNNIVQLRSPGIAKCYETDFEELWNSGQIAGTGKNDLGNANVDGREIDVAFSPGDGRTVEQEIAGAIQGAGKTVAIASMVISSGPILGSLIDAIDRGVEVTGIYDGPEMNNVIGDWTRGSASGKSAGKQQQWNKIKSKLVAKWSVPYSPKNPSAPHNFMHNKLVAVDDKVVISGSFNFSENATHNAENVLTLHDAAIATQYATYVRQLVTAYKNTKPGKAALAAGGGKAAGKRKPRPASGRRKRR